MLKEKYELKTRTVTELVCTYRKRTCDICGKEITAPYRHAIFAYEFSDDEEIDICSEECSNKVYRRWMELVERISSFDIPDFNMSYERCFD